LKILGDLGEVNSQENRLLTCCWDIQWGSLAKKTPPGQTSKTDLELILLFKNTEQCPSNPCPFIKLRFQNIYINPKKNRKIMF
jgi:hypothetical protein